MIGCDVCGGDGLHRPNCKVVEQRMAAATTPPGSAKSAREVLAQHADALDHIDRIGGLGFRAHDVIAAARDALRALLDAQPGSVERLCEAAERCTTIPDKGYLTEKEQEQNGIDLKAALAAVRASPEAIGAGAKKCSCAFSEKDDDARCNPAACNCAGCHADEWRGALARVTEERNEAMRQRNAFADRLSAIAKGYGGPFATPEERVEYCERGRETLTNDLKTLRAERDSLKADLAAARAELDRIPAATLPPLSDRVKWVAQYIKEHVSLDEDSARVLAKEGAEILRIAEEAVMAKEAPRG